MRNQEEIQRIHDLLVGILKNETPLHLGDSDRWSAAASLDVLCWVLQHESNPHFANAVQELEKLAAQRGYVLDRGHQGRLN